MTKVLYPGSFDPITKGHMNIIAQAINIFDEVLVAVLFNPTKRNFFFSLEERLELLERLYYHNPHVKVITGDTTSVDLALLYNCATIIRGLRSTIDFEYEHQLAQINRDISDNKINTICLFTDPNLQAISSSTVKEVFNLNKNISKYVDPIVEQQMLLKKAKSIN